MLVKSLELYNFKSHKNTLIEFRHYTCLIGLNGSGKSNILDAVKYVLYHEFPGEPSCHKNIDDLLHKGSTKMRVKICLSKEKDQITLTREIYKTDSAEQEKFFLNEENVSLRRYREFIKSMKLDYSIISQNSTSKIQIFNNIPFHIERLSGSGKYKKSYDEITERIKKETVILKNIFKKIKIRSQNIEKSEFIQKKQKELEDLMFRKKFIEKSIFTMKIQVKDREISNYERELDELELDISIKKKENCLFEQSLKKIRKEIKENQIEYLETKNDYKKIIFSENENFPLLKQQKEKELKQISSTIKKLAREMENQENTREIKKLKEEYHTLLYTFNQKHSDLIKKENKFSKLHQKSLENHKIIEKAAKNIEKGQNLLKNKQSRLEELRTKVEHADLRAYSDLKKKEKELNGILSFYLIHKNNLKIETSKSQIIETLKALFPGVKGKISVLIDVTQQKYRIAINSFLNNKNAIIVDTKETALKCINYLESKKLCRLTFYCVDTFREQYSKNVPIQEDYVVRAMDCITFPEELKNIVNHFLENCYILMDNSRKEDFVTLIGKKKVRFTTLQGTLFQNTYITGGPVTVNLDSNIITELNQISEKIQSLDHISVIVERIDEIAEEIKILNLETGEMKREQKNLIKENQNIQEGLREYEKVQSKIFNLKNEHFKSLLQQKFQSLEDLETYLDTEKIERAKNEKKGMRDGLIYEKNVIIREIQDISAKISAFANESKLKSDFNTISTRIQDLRNKFENERAKNENFVRILSEKTKKQLFIRDQIERLEMEKEEITQEAFLDEIIENEDDVNNVPSNILSQPLRSSQSLGSLSVIHGKDQISQKEIELIKIKSQIDEIYTFCTSTSKTNQSETEFLQKFTREYEKKKIELRKIRNVLRDIRKKRCALFFECFNSLVDILTKIMACFNQTAQLTCDNKTEPYLKEIKYFILKDQVTVYDALSGGEKALALFAFIFSVNILQGSSFCFFDEIDAALDKEYATKLSEMLDSNELQEHIDSLEQSSEVSRIGKNFLKKVQIICISHKKDFFLHSDSLIGVYKNHSESKILGYAFN